MASWDVESFFSTKSSLSLPALYYENTTISYQKLSNMVLKMAANLRKKGVTLGSKVALQPTLTPDAIVVFFALLVLGASPYLFSTRLPKKQITNLLKLSQSAFFFDLPTLTLQKLQGCEKTFPHIALCTSGSSGHPKLACLSRENFFESAFGSIFRLRLKESSYLLSLPLFHVSGLSILFRSLVSQSAILLESPSHPLLHRATHCSMVPTQLLRLLEKDISLYYPKLQCLLLGGAPVAESLLKRALAKNVPIQTTYGMTEMASQITLSDPNDPFLSLHLGTCLPGRELCIDSSGEILTRGSVLFSGYYKEGKVLKPMTSDGWFATGDLGKVSEEGNLLYKGRKDLMFISGGENIYPEEIERALGTLSDISEAIVVPIQDPEYGQRPVAFLRVNGAFPSKEEIHEKLSSLLPRFCLPVHLLPFPESSRQEMKMKRQDLQKAASALFCDYLGVK
jgi:o-succinylbenzoate---CoA ligase